MASKKKKKDSSAEGNSGLSSTEVKTPERGGKTETPPKGDKSSDKPEKDNKKADKADKKKKPSAGESYFTAILQALVIALLIRFFLVEPYKIPSGSMIPTLLIGDHIFISKLAYGVRIPIIGKLAAHWGGYERGDVIVFSNPLDDDLPIMQQRDYVKRIVGLPGETVEVVNEVIRVNGVPQERTPIETNFQYFDRRFDSGQWFRREAELLEESLVKAAIPAPKDGESAAEVPPAEGDALKVHSVLRDPKRDHRWMEGPFRVPEGHLFVMGDNRDNSQDGRYGRNGAWFVPFDHVKGRAFVIWFSWGENGLRFGRLGTGL